MTVRANGAMGFVGSLDDDPIQRAADRIEARLDRLGSNVEKQGQRFDALGKRIGNLVGTYLSVTAATNFVKSMVQVRGEFQQLEVAYTTILKSKQKADTLMAQTVQLAAVTPFTLTEVAQSTKQLLAYGFGAESVTRTLEMLGNVAAGVSAPIGDIAYLYGTLKTQGRAYSRDIMQFTSRGIPILDELAKVTGKNVKEVQKLIEAGKIGFPQVEQAFRNLTGPAGTFYNLMQLQSKTLTGQLSNLEDAWDRMLNDMGKSNEGVLNGAIQQALKLVENYEKVLEVVQLLIIAYGAYRAALIITSVHQKIVAAGMAQQAATTAAAAAATTALTEAELANASAMTVMRNGIKGIIPYLSTLVGAAGAIAAVGAAIGGIVYAGAQYQDGAEMAAESLTEAREDGAKAADNERERISRLIAVLKDSTQTKEEQKRAYDELQSTTNGMLSKYSQEQIAAGAADGAIRQFTEAVNKAKTAESEYASYKALEEKMDTLKKKGYDAIGMWDKLWISIKRTFAPTSQGMTTSQWWKELFSSSAANSAVVAEKTKDLKVARGRILLGPNGQKVKELIAQGNKPGTPPVTKTDVPGLSDEELKKLQKYKEDKQKLLDDIAEMENKSREDGMTNDERELAEIADKYTKMRKIIEDHNKKVPKAFRIGAGAMTRIDNAETAERGNTQYRQATDKLKESLDKQKQLYKDFEDYREQFGEEAAKKQYDVQFDSFADFMKKKYDLELSAAAKDGTITGPEAERIELLSKEYDDAVKDQKDHLTKLMAGLLSYEEQRKLLTANYQRDRAEIEKTGNKTAMIERERRYNDEVNELDDNNIQKMDAYKRLFYGIENMSEASARIVIANAQAMLDEYVGKGQISADLAREILDKINGAKAAVASRLPEKLNAAAGELREIATAIGQIDQNLGGILGQLSGVIAGFASVRKNVDDFKAAKNRQGGADKLGMLTSGLGAVGAGIGVVTSVISGISGFFKAAKESKKEAQRQLEAFKAQQFAAEFEVNELYRERLREQVRINKLKIEGLKAEGDLLKKQSSDVQKDYNTVLQALYGQQFVAGKGTKKTGGFLGIGRKTEVYDIMGSLAGKSYDDLEKLFISGQLTDKAKELFQTLQKLKQEGADIDKQLTDLAAESAEIFTGTTAEAITDMIADGFANGFTSVQDFAEDTENIIRKAMLNALKYQALEAPIKKLYEQFAADAKDGLDANETQKFKDGINKTITDAAAFAKLLEQATGVQLSDAQASLSKNSLSGALASASQESIDLLSGYTNANRMIMLDMIGVSRETLACLMRIEVSSERTADNTDRLAAIEGYLFTMSKKMDDPLNVLKANGKVG